MPDKGQKANVEISHIREKNVNNTDFVLEKNIFSNIFEKDIRRVFIYKKAERLAKAIHLITPAFTNAPSLRDRVDALAIGLIDAAIMRPPLLRTMLSKELLALSSVLSIARTGGLLSSMNADLIAREAQSLLQEVAAYEEPNLFLDQSPSLADLARGAARNAPKHLLKAALKVGASPKKAPSIDKGHIKDTPPSDRRESVISAIQNKGQASIKDISSLIRGVSEKTIQRELQSLVESGIVKKTGERRWSSYSIA